MPTRAIDVDVCLVIDEQFYSVPPALVHQKVEGRATARSVEILHRGKRVAVHPRSYRFYKRLQPLDVGLADEAFEQA
jgi:hypothetical protein